MKRLTALFFVMTLSVFSSACGSNVADQVNDAIDLANGVPEKDLDLSTFGVNSFFNDTRFGSIPTQFGEIKGTLGISHVRVLLAWNDAVQSSPTASPNFGFYDSVLGAIPAGVDALVVLTGTPTWMSNSANWIAENPRRTFVERWVKPVTTRYKGNGRISSWEIWNEPNEVGRADNQALDLGTSPVNFVELVSLATDACRAASPSKLVVSGPTTAINQNYPDTLNYNKGLRDAGISSVVDVYGIHYYGRQYENVLKSGGVGDFLSSISNPIWVTESGAQGTQEQLHYVRQTFPFLTDNAKNIARYYYYQMYENTNPKVTYGLRNLTTADDVSDLYLFLRGGK